MPSFPFAESPEFLRLLRGDGEPDLTRLALEIARDAYPSLDPADTLRRIDALAARVRDRCPDGARPRHIVGQINWVLFVEEKYQGNSEDYYDPRNSYLNQVVDRKFGIPISLSVLYMAVAERIGLEMAGVNLPAHFVVRTGRGTSTLFVDPFHGGAILDRSGCEARVAEVTGQDVALPDSAFAPSGVGEIAARMLRNLKAVYLRSQDFASALPVLRRLVALSREDPIERRDLGVACLKADRPGEALDHLPAYLEARPEADDADVVASLVRAARRKLAGWN